MKYRKKPVVIEAWKNDDWDTMPDWVSDAGRMLPQSGKIVIKTLEGNMTANKGDWIIKGVNGEVYPCKPDIFDATYEPVICSDQSSSDAAR